MLSRVLLAATLLTTAANAAEFDSVSVEEEVNASAEATWQKIGDFCAPAIWLKAECEIVGGPKGRGELGSIRRLHSAVFENREAMVSRTPLSYTYGVIDSKVYYHGTLQVAPAGEGKAKITYTQFYDAESLKTPEAKAAERENRRTRMVRSTDGMKVLVEGK